MPNPKARNLKFCHMKNVKQNMSKQEHAFSRITLRVRVLKRPRREVMVMVDPKVYFLSMKITLIMISIVDETREISSPIRLLSNSSAICQGSEFLLKLRCCINWSTTATAAAATPDSPSDRHIHLPPTMIRRIPAITPPTTSPTVSLSGDVSHAP